MGSKDIIFRIGGEGGEGIISVGSLTAEAVAREGYNVLTFKTFPAEIKGGYAMYQLRISTERIASQGDSFDVLVVFNNTALELNRHLLKEGTVLIYDSEGGDIEDLGDTNGAVVYPLPMSRIARDDLQNYRAKNMVAIGAMSELFDIPAKCFEEKITDKFSRKGDKVVESNIVGFNAGRNYVKENLTKKDSFKVAEVESKTEKIVISGNDAIGLGALIGGCNFFSMYPITPATDIPMWLAKYLPKLGGTLIQAEDEIAALGNTIGGAFAGAKAMTATSGPGVSLMLELLGLASIAELPLVLANVQRGGPSTGLPTKHEQSDLFICALGGHGDMPRVVISPENVSECVSLTIKAFNVAQKYQLPVMVLSDGSLGMRTETVDRPDVSKIEIVDAVRGTAEGDERFNRYKHTANHISPIAYPGDKGGAHWITGLEHNEKGAPNTSAGNRNAMMQKRFEKLADIEDYFPETEVEGAEDAEIGVISWGSTQGSVREAVERMVAEGKKVSALYPKLIWPLPKKALEKFAIGKKKILIPEINYQGQFADIIAANTSINPIKQTIYAGLPFNPQEIEDKIEELLND